MKMVFCSFGIEQKPHAVPRAIYRVLFRLKNSMLYSWQAQQKLLQTTLQ